MRSVLVEPPLRIRAASTTRVSLELVGAFDKVSSFFTMIGEWKPLIAFILSACPALQEVVIRLPVARDFLNVDDDLASFLDCIGALLEWVMEEVLPEMQASTRFVARAFYVVPEPIMVIIIRRSESGLELCPSP